MLNIERHPLHKNRWIGYSEKGVWSITKANSKSRKFKYLAIPTEQGSKDLFYAGTLREVSKKLEEI